MTDTFLNNLSVVELGDALTQPQQQEKRVYQLATTQMGFTEAEWRRIKFGESDVRPLGRDLAAAGDAQVRGHE